MRHVRILTVVDMPLANEIPWNAIRVYLEKVNFRPIRAPREMPRIWKSMNVTIKSVKKSSIVGLFINIAKNPNELVNCYHSSQSSV